MDVFVICVLVVGVLVAYYLLLRQHVVDKRYYSVALFSWLTVAIVLVHMALDRRDRNRQPKE